MKNEALLEELTQAFGVAGFETEVREIIRREVEPYADEVREDAIGNLIVLKKVCRVRIKRESCLPLTWMRSDLW